MSRTAIYPLFIIGILFFVFGFLTWINGILIPFFQICLGLNNFQSTWVAFASYVAYFVMALPSSWLLSYTGYKKGMFIGLCVMALGTLLFIPAAYSRTYSLFLAGLFITGSGLALLQAAANPYLAVIGPIESHAQRIGFMGLANKIAGLLSLAIFGSVFLLNADDISAQLLHANSAEQKALLDAYALKVVNPYLIVTAVLLALAVMIYFSHLPEVNDQKNEELEEEASKTSIFQYPYLWFGVLALFCSAACEVIPIDGIIIYSKAIGISLNTSRYFATFTLYAMIVGYIASAILIPKYLSQHKALAWCGVWGGGLAVTAYLSSGFTSIMCLILMGFSAAMLWGTIWGLSLKGLGRFTKTGAALLLMAVIGGGVFPVIFGRLIDINRDHPQSAVLLLVPCYLILILFAVKGRQIKSWKKLRT